MQAVLAPTCSAVRAARPVTGRRTVPAVRAQSSNDAQAKLVKATALASLAGAFLSAGSVQAAAEVSQLAAGGDGRASILLSLAVPVVGWVGFNILGPAQRQLENMSKKSVAGAIGLGAASMLLASSADAAEIMQLAERDDRIGILGLVVVIALGWVGFNILGPAQRQLENMSKKSVAGAIGLGAASMLLASSADAAEIMQLADSDNRIATLGLVVVIALGWVGFNILGPAQRQLDNMSKKKGK